MEKNKHIPSFSFGQSLVEVIVMVAVVTMIVTALVAGTVSALKATNYSSSKSQATKYAQEGMELVRKDRDASWTTFFARAGVTYCIPDPAPNGSSWVQSNNCPGNISDPYGQYTRSASFVWVPASSEMTVTVTVKWNEGNTTHQSQLVSNFTQWR